MHDWHRLHCLEIIVEIIVDVIMKIIILWRSLRIIFLNHHSQTDRVLAVLAIIPPSGDAVLVVF